MKLMMTRRNWNCGEETWTATKRSNALKDVQMEQDAKVATNKN
jgi:hypothetical protein